MAQLSSGAARVELPTDTRIVITREFDAPRELVYEAYTTPELVRRWWHGKRGEVTVADIDLRVGGKWRYVMLVQCDGDVGGEAGFHGEYREIVPNEKIVSTEIFEGIPDPFDPETATVNTATFTSVDGRTRLEILVDCPSKAVRDAIIESGMESGLQDALDLLEEVAISLR